MQAQHDRPCCINNSTDGYARSCNCIGVSDKDECQEICTNDSKCKGYTIGNNAYCSIATTVEQCPTGCEGPNLKTNVGPLDPQGQCGRVAGLWEGGCHIKQGWHL